MLDAKFNSVAATAMAVLAILVGSAGLAFANANKQGCGTRLRTYNTIPVTRTVKCVQMGCPSPCTPITLSDGDMICSCDGTSQNPASYYDPSTPCVGTIEISGGAMGLECHRGPCTSPCEFGTESFPASDGPPPHASGNDAWCKCP